MWKYVFVSIAILLVSALMLVYGHQSVVFPRSTLQESEAEEVFQNQPVASTTPDALHIPIFIYHSVRPDFFGETAQQKRFSITPELFEQQLRYLQSHGYTTISLDELAQDVENGTTSPIARPVVLTIDDGGRNQYEYASPLLKKYHDTAAFFVYTNPIGKNSAFLTWDQIKELDAAGMTIGDHTLSHPYLSKLTSEQLRAEVQGGKKTLEDHLGKPVVHFASPFGYTSAALVALLRESGFKTGRTTYKGAHHSKDDLLQLTGFLVHRDMHDFIWALQYSF